MPATVAATPPAFDAIVAAGIAGLALGVAALVLLIWRRHRPGSARRAAVVVATWLALSGALAASGALARLDLRPPPAALLIATVLGLAITIGLSRAGGALADAVPLATLVSLQAFRLPLELVMHRAATLGIMPPELSYSGYNFDIVTGTTACALAVLMATGTRVPRAVLVAWNIWGLGCLAAIAAIAVAASPMVRAFGDDPRHVNTWVLHVPYVWLPTVLVVVALAGHIVIARKLRRMAARPSGH